MYLQNKGFRYIEALVFTLIITIGGCFAAELVFSKPSLTGILFGFVPGPRIVTNQGMLYVSIGILGATVMPHNLYLHSSIVQTRKYLDTQDSKREAIRFATIDSSVALMSALFIVSGYGKLIDPTHFLAGPGPKRFLEMIGGGTPPTWIGYAIAGIEITDTRRIEFKLPGQPPETKALGDLAETPRILWEFMQRFEIKPATEKPVRAVQGLFGYTTFDAVQFFDTIRFRDRGSDGGAAAGRRRRCFP